MAAVLTGNRMGSLASGIGGGTGRNPQLQAFHARLKRIESQAGARERERREIRRLQLRRVRERRRQAGGGLMTHLLGFGAGAAAVVAVRLLRARFFEADLTGGGLGGDLLATMAGDTVLALVVALAIATILRLGTRHLAMAQMAGIFAMLIGMHNLVHLAPGAFAQAFPEPWVAHVLAATTPHSLLLPGESIVF